jgi:hypothetical protein
MNSRTDTVPLTLYSTPDWVVIVIVPDGVAQVGWTVADAVGAQRRQYLLLLARMIVTHVASAEFLTYNVVIWSQPWERIRGLICFIQTILHSCLSRKYNRSWWRTTSRLYRAWCCWNRRRKAQHLLLSPMTTLSHKYYHLPEHIKYNHSESSLKMYSKLDKLFRLNYIQLLIARGNTNTARLHSTCRLSNTRSCQQPRRYWINSCSRSRYGHTTSARFLTYV